MKKLTAKLCCLVLLLVFTLNQAEAQKVSLSFVDLGAKPVLIQGQRGQTSFVLKIPEYVATEDIALRLNFKRSEVLNLQKSILSVFKDGEQVKTGKLSDSAAFSWDIGGLDVNGADRVLKIQILSELAISDEPCKDLGSSGLWLRLLESSYLVGDTLARERSNLFISNCFESKQAIVVPNDLQVQQEPSVAKLAFAINNLTGNKLPVIYESELASKGYSNYVFIGLEDQVPLVLSRQLSFLSNQKAGRVELMQTPNRDTTKNFDNYEILLVTGVNQTALEKAVNILLDEDVIRSTFSKSATALLSKTPYNSELVGLNPYITFNDLGAWNHPLGGVGASSLSLNFQRADIVFPCTYIDIRLAGHFTGLKAKDAAYINLYINEQLVKTQELGTNGNLELNAKVSMSDLLSSNTLRYEFLYIPSEENCNQALNTFIAQLNPAESGIIFPDNASHKPATFNYFPENFYSKDISIIYSPGFGLKSIEALSQMIQMLNNSRGLNDWLIPEIVNTREVRPKDHKSNNRIYLLSTADSTFFNNNEAVIHRAGDVVSLRKENNTSFRMLLDSELAFGQIYEDGGEIILALLTDPVTNINGLENLMDKLSGKLGNESFDAISSRGGNFLFYNINKDQEVDENQGLSKLAIHNFWSKYGIVLSVLVIGLLVALFFVLNKRNQLDSDLF